jgi:hypothetical protein
MNETAKKMLVSALVVAAFANGAIGIAAAATTCWASSPTWNGYWIGPTRYVARTMAIRQCQANTPYGMYCHIENCDD